MQLSDRDFNTTLLLNINILKQLLFNVIHRILKLEFKFMKKISLLLMTILVAFSISAQETENVSHGDIYLKNKGTDNWFMSLAGGTNTFWVKEVKTKTL